MKRILTILVAMVLTNVMFAQKVLRDDYQKLQVKFEMGELRMEELVVDGRVFTALTADGCMNSSEEGAPSLPTFSALIEVPLCGGFEVAVSEAVYDTILLKGRVVMPLQPSRSKSDIGHHSLVIDRKIYATDAFYGVDEAMVEAVGVARDRNLARLQFSPVKYNPVAGKLIVCRSAVVTVSYRDANEGASKEMFERYHSPAFASGGMTLNSLYPKEARTTAPIRYLIVAHSSFRGQLDGFVQWKRRKGFLTDIVYTDNSAVGTTSTSIANYVKSQYTNATTTSPAPTYLLLVGDHEQIPAFSAQVSRPSSDHITDLYYISWTSGDNIPDCYCGRFSAQTVAQLTPQIEKTLMYEQYTFSDPSFLDRAVMVAGVDGGSSGDYGYTHADPAMDYAITNYVNGAHGFSQVKYFKNNTSIVPTGSNVTVGSSASSNSATVRGYYNEGAGWINYSAHGSATSWGTPNFTTSHASAMTNSQKFGLMIGNCCLTNKFETSTCLGEALLRKGNYCGAVGYIGGSNSTYWDEDVYWAVGVRSSISPSMSMAYNASNLGVYDRAFHTHSEAYSDWIKSQGEIVFRGNMAVQSSSSSYKRYYWEIYHLMGDPSLMPYLTQASQMTLMASSTLPIGSSSLTVTAVPYAYVALTDTATRTLVASGFANASGTVTLSLPTGMTVGGYELAASAQQYRTAFRAVSVVPTQGPYVQVVSVTPQSDFVAGATVQLLVKIANIGNNNASGVSVNLASNNTSLSLTGNSISVGSISAGDTVTRIVTASVGSQIEDGSQVTLTASANYSGSATPTSNTFTFTLRAPVVVMAISNRSPSILPGSNVTVAVTVSNTGHATLGSSSLALSSGNAQLSVSAANDNSFSLVAGASITRQFTLQAASAMALDINVPVTIQLTGPVTMTETMDVYIGEPSIETFEGGNFAVQDWVQGSYPWVIVSGESQEGSYCARSATNLSHNQTSEMSITVNVSRADSISFYYKVSSEANYDKFHFYIDGEEKVVGSGVVNWTRASFPVTTGNHTFKFTYSKDVSVNSNSDCAWIDNITLPRPLPNYTVTVTTPHGTPTGSGSYPQGESVTVGVYPQAGYSFVGWNDGVTMNPRQVIVSGNLHFTATLVQGDVVTIHDTAYVAVHDTMHVIIHDSTYVNVHDTTFVVQYDTAYLSLHDTTFVTLYDTTYVPLHDTVYLTQYDTAYVIQFDTTYLMQIDTVMFVTVDTVVLVQTDTVTVVQTDTVTLIQTEVIYEEVIDTMFVHDTVNTIVYVPMVEVDTVMTYVYDTVTNIQFDTVNYYIFDTTIVTDTLWLHDTVFIHDTIYISDEGIEDVTMRDVKIYQRGGCIEVEGALGYPVRFYDAVGREARGKKETENGNVRMFVPSSGVYLVKVGELPARRVVVIK